jgi:hypothetical protein
LTDRVETDPEGVSTTGAVATRDPVGLSLILPLRSGRGHPPLPRHLHAGLLRLVGEVGSDLARVLHDDPGPSGHPWAISAPFRHNGRWWFRLSAVGPSAPAWLCGAIRPATLTPTGWAIGERAGWRWRLAEEPDLAPEPGGRDADEVALAFLSPTSLSAVRGPHGDPLPVAPRVLESLRGRAASHAGGRLADAAAAVGAQRLAAWCATRIRITAFALHSAECPTVNTGGRAEPLIGGLGWTVIELRGPSCAERELATALLAAAIYLGVGRKLSYGMGQGICIFGRPGDAAPELIGWSTLWALHDAWR